MTTDASYSLMLEGIEQEINRCARHAVSLSALSLQLIDVLSKVVDPDERDYAALLLEKIELLEDGNMAARVEPPAPVQYWLQGVEGAVVVVKQAAVA
jgi:hypothetical protein